MCVYVCVCVCVCLHAVVCVSMGCHWWPRARYVLCMWVGVTMCIAAYGRDIGELAVLAPASDAEDEESWRTGAAKKRKSVPADA